jgi:UTP--glucose-1-phosphate uridylyltransferase
MLQGAIEPVREIPEVSYERTGRDRGAYEAGVQALSQGQVAVLVLNGGLATRFGGVVKGTVLVFDDRSFLGLKIADVVRADDLFHTRIPLVIMNSFATRHDTALHLQQNGHFGIDPSEIMSFDQSVSIRLEESGDPFIGSDGVARYYAPGHGEFFQRIRQSGVYEQLVERGIRYVTFSNIDNLGASIDPWLLGHHILSRRDMTIEVIPRTRNSLGQWDVGGAPVVYENREQVIEGFRLPPSLAPDALSDFQTNNMYFSMDALKTPPTLPRYWVSKQIEGRRSVSFEAVTCEATTVLRDETKPWLTLNLVRVPRRGPRGRFFPVKSRDDLTSVQEEIRARTEEGWALREKDARGG